MFCVLLFGERNNVANPIMSSALSAKSMQSITAELSRYYTGLVHGVLPFIYTRPVQCTHFTITGH